VAPKVSPEYRQERRQHIIDSAARCFARDGFHRATMADICREAEVSPGAVYLYFKSKDEIVKAFCDGIAERDAAIFDQAVQGRSTREALRNLADLFFGAMDSPESVVRAGVWTHIWAEHTRRAAQGEPVEEVGRPINERFLALVRRAQERGEINPALDPDSVRMALFTVFEGFLIHIAAKDPGARPRQYAEVIGALFLGEFWHGGPASAASRPRAVAPPIGGPALRKDVRLAGR
jgi:TetR/AcrR family transcriptional regulator, repressor for uid operon